MASKLGIRLTLLEVQLKELRREIELGAKYGTQVSSEVLYRMWQAEREDNTRLRLLMQEREREREALRERIESGLRLLYDRAAEISARLSGLQIKITADVSPAAEALAEAEQQILGKFRSELQKGTEGRWIP